MRVFIHKKFEKDFKGIVDVSVQNHILGFIKDLKKASHISELKNIQKCSGFSVYYKHRFRDYRVGIFWNGESLVLERVLHRSNIYKKWPV